MKNILSFIIALFLFLNMNAQASEIDVLATMQTKTNLQDKVWVGTFQIVWNDFIDRIVHDIVRFREGTPAYVQDLNNREFSVTDISDDCYYKKVGVITKNTKKEISKAIKKKFNETSDILDDLNLKPAPNSFIVYAILKKDFEFLNEFDKLGKSNFANNKKAEYFGITKHSDKILKRGVKVLFYNNRNDLAVILDTKGKDEVYLYKNDSNKPFDLIYKEMNRKASKYKGPATLGRSDELKVPNIKFDIKKAFKEIENKRVMGTNILISQAMESIKFDMNNKGVKLKSEAAITGLLTALPPAAETPKYFYFDNTFVIFLKEKGKEKPYFALRVSDISNYQ